MSISSKLRTQEEVKNVSSKRNTLYIKIFIRNGLVVINRRTAFIAYTRVIYIVSIWLRITQIRDFEGSEHWFTFTFIGFRSDVWWVDTVDTCMMCADVIQRHPWGTRDSISTGGTSLWTTATCLLPAWELTINNFFFISEYIPYIQGHIDMK